MCNTYFLCCAHTAKPQFACDGLGNCQCSIYGVADLLMSYDKRQKEKDIVAQDNDYSNGDKYYRAFYDISLTQECNCCILTIISL